MRDLILIINQLIETWASIMGRGLIQGTIVFCGILVMCRVFPKIKPSTRCWLWRLAYINLLLIIFLRVPINLPITHTQSDYRDKVVLEESFVSKALQDTDREYRAYSREKELKIIPFAFIIWLLGVYCVGCRLVRSWRITQKFLYTCKPLEDKTIINLYERLCRRMRIRNSPELLESYSNKSPLLIGWFYPRIVLPLSLSNNYNSSEIESILAHELAHAKRHDLIWNSLITICQILFFFNPLIRLGKRELEISQEVSCDEYAIKMSNISLKQYGYLLLRIVENFDFKKEPILTAVGATQSYLFLKERLSTLKHVDNPIGRLEAAQVILVIALVVLMIIPWQLNFVPISHIPKEADLRIRELGQYDNDPLPLKDKARDSKGAYIKGGTS